MVPTLAVTMSSTSTFRVSPGSAPVTAIGPVAGFTQSQPIDEKSWSSELIVFEKQSMVSTTTVCPDSICWIGSC